MIMKLKKRPGPKGAVEPVKKRDRIKERKHRVDEETQI
jgi:hypothetical protein